MFLSPPTTAAIAKRFPRVRGDVPRLGDLKGFEVWFSPRARGCSRHGVADAAVGAVFPACAGMFLRIVLFLIGIRGFPRVRGDVPAWVIMFKRVASFSRAGDTHTKYETAFTQEIGIVKSFGIIVDGFTMEIKTITASNRINNRVKSEKQACMLLHGTGAVENSKKGIISNLKTQYITMAIILIIYSPASISKDGFRMH